MQYNLKNPGQHRPPAKENPTTNNDVPPQRAHLPDPKVNQMMTDQYLPVSEAEQEQSAIDAIINQIEKTPLVEGATADGLHSPTVGMTQAPLVTKLHSPIINMNRSTKNSSPAQEGDATWPLHDAPTTVEEYLQKYHPDYTSQPTEATVYSIDATFEDIHPDPISPQQHAQFQL